MKTDFLKEITTMKKIAAGRCPYVVNMVGCSTTQEPLALVLELVSNGDLLSFLRSSRAPVSIPRMRMCMSTHWYTLLYTQWYTLLYTQWYTCCTHNGIPCCTHTGTPSCTHTGIPSCTYTGIPSCTHNGIHCCTHNGIPCCTHNGIPCCTHTGIPAVHTLVYPAVHTLVYLLYTQWYTLLYTHWYTCCTHNGILCCTHTGISFCTHTGIPYCTHTGILCCTHTGIPCCTHTGIPCCTHTGIHCTYTGVSINHPISNLNLNLKLILSILSHLSLCSLMDIPLRLGKSPILTLAEMLTRSLPNQLILVITTLDRRIPHQRVPSPKLATSTPTPPTLVILATTTSPPNRGRMTPIRGLRAWIVGVTSP